MSASAMTKRKIVLHSRPQGMPTLDNFRLQKEEIMMPKEGQVLLKIQYISLDPYVRGRMSDAPSYVAPIALNETIAGGTVCRVVNSKHANFKEGDLVLSFCGWQDYMLSDGSNLTKLDPSLKHPSYVLSLLGMPGFTAYTGLLKIGEPKSGETVVVASASGAVGSVVGQIAKIKGCRVIGIAGGKDKCDYVVKELGFDICLDRYEADLAKSLAAACPNGIDVYYENVGGVVFDAVLPLLNVHARVPVCGLIAHYNDTALPTGPDRLSMLMTTILKKRIKMQGFIISDYYQSGFAEFSEVMGKWLQEDKVKLREDIVQGLENTPQAFIDFLQGKHFGKVVVQVS